MTAQPAPSFQPIIHIGADDHVHAHLLAADGGTLCGLALNDDAGWHMCALSCHADELVLAFHEHVCSQCAAHAHHIDDLSGSMIMPRLKP